MSLSTFIYPTRVRPSQTARANALEEFQSDHSRIVFCSSFRRMIKKAQVFSLESNTSVRNRLTHSLEVADVGRTLARSVGRQLEAAGRATPHDTECMAAIVENACLLHDIGNPPFGHFGEEAIKSWFSKKASKQLAKFSSVSPEKEESVTNDFKHFDGNPQGFRIATRLHSEVDEYGLNLTCSTLLAMIKYPHCGPPPEGAKFSKKQGIFLSESARYDEIHDLCSAIRGKRYFLAYLMELADDICYCLSDIADSFEKEVTTWREYKAEIRSICKDAQVDGCLLRSLRPIDSFPHQIAIPVSQQVIKEAAKHFADNLDAYLAGEATEMSDEIPSGRLLECLKTFAKRVIYKSPEAQRIEIAGCRIVRGLLKHYGMLLRVPRSDFEHFITHKEMRKGSRLDMEWRVFNQLAPRMLKVYRKVVANIKDDVDEWNARAKLIVDYVSGMTDDSARDAYQNFMGISV